jgi:hypothetical protein
MELFKHLLFSEEEFELNSILNGTKVRGSYSTMQFVLRLRDDVRSALNNKEFKTDYIQAHSTVIHENIHWWQHIGSNFGFLFSLAYPAFIHISYGNLHNAIRQGITYKSILKFEQLYYEKYGKTDMDDINIILNNYYDLEYAKAFALDNKNINTISEDNRFFLNVGHCYHILWSSTIHTVAATLDKEYKFLPNTNNWVECFRKLEKEQVPGFFIDTSMHVSPIGIKAIYEGQAIFNQMQYLTIALNPDLTYKNFEDIGMLHGIYTEAFEFFLQWTKLSKPTNLLDPKVGLFLLVCDLAINPTNGFPNDIYDFENFINKNDPGIRFFLLCYIISQDPSRYVSKINLYSKEEYISLSKDLSESTGCRCPYESINTVLSWANDNIVSKILEEEAELKFSNDNLPIRLMFSKYYRFQEDKLKYPNVFCWFGYHANSSNGNVDFEIIDMLYAKHHALFTDDFDGEIKPSLFKGRTEENIMNSFNTFYEFNIMYDLLLKWIYEEGEFKYDYKWLAGERAKTFTPIIKEKFTRQFGIDIDKIQIV